MTSGASSAWHDLALYLIARFSGTEAAQEVARFFMLQWHPDGQARYPRNGRTGAYNSEEALQVREQYRRRPGYTTQPKGRSGECRGDTCSNLA